MATDLGKVGMRMRGDWSSSATYEVLDAVTDNNGLYIAKQEVPANTPTSNTTYWQKAVDISGSSTVNSFINNGRLKDVSGGYLVLGKMVIVNISATGNYTGTGKMTVGTGFPAPITTTIKFPIYEEDGTLGWGAIELIEGTVYFRINNVTSDVKYQICTSYIMA